MVIIEYECEECGEVQDKWLHRLASVNEEKCDKCGAPAEKLQKLLSKPKPRLDWQVPWNG